jgi:hypothetical protein
LGFLGGGRLKQPVSDEEIAALQNWVIQGITKQMRLVKNPSLATRRDTALIAAICAPPLLEEPFENGPKTASKSRKPMCYCGTRQSRNHASLSPCASGTPGGSGWPGRINGGSTANLSNGANQHSFFPGQTALPWAGQPCITLCGDSTW